MEDSLIIFSFSFFNFNISFSDKDKYFIKLLIKEEIKLEYIIWGSWYTKLKVSSSSYIWSIVVSEKNKAFIA